ncbi:MAG: tRNA (adenosine(37)-N6)-threonylcarbamoyltransferase complex ATPase subunit type 1 TsaE [Candidatus Thioglobus sp.]|nr:tRNA (adenosine(37)-N6)-threonylcarbamoyltransferase complex ATPase subunit type 1 TsaE [Candidatus Thioglobus sp.]
MNLVLKNQQQTYEFSQQLAKCCQALDAEIVIYLQGDLGAGKTTFARGFIQYFGFEKVKSPTYSLVESYQNQQINIHHFDCYRLSSAEELEYIGVRDYADGKNIQLIEWANLGQGAIKAADITINLSGSGERRLAVISDNTKIGKQLLGCFLT